MIKQLIRTSLAAAVAFSLSGCWLGPRFYSDEQTVTAMPAGTYRIVDIEDPTGRDQIVNERAIADSALSTRVRIAYQPDGRMLVSNLGSSDDPQVATMVPLEGVPGFDRLFVFQVGMEGTDLAVYGIINLTDDGYQLVLPPCDSTRRLADGSPIIVGGLLLGRRTCRFNDRVVLESTLRQFAQDPIRWTTYRRYGR